MNENIKKLLGMIHKKDLNEFIEDHIKEININNETKEIDILLDKRYTMNFIHSSHYTNILVNAIKDCFGADNTVVFKLKNPHKTHDREMLVPHAIHY